MADYHIREVSTDMKTVSCVFHIAIPTGNNSVSVSWRAALVEYLGGADNITSVLLDISSADLAKLKAGELLERSVTVRFSSLTMTDAERLADVLAAYNSEKTSILAELQIILKYYDYSGSV